MERYFRGPIAPRLRRRRPIASISSRSPRRGGPRFDFVAFASKGRSSLRFRRVRLEGAVLASISLRSPRSAAHRRDGPAFASKRGSSTRWARVRLEAQNPRFDGLPFASKRSSSKRWARSYLEAPVIEAIASRSPRSADHRSDGPAVTSKRGSSTRWGPLRALQRGIPATNASADGAVAASASQRPSTAASPSAWIRDTT